MNQDTVYAVLLLVSGTISSLTAFGVWRRRSAKAAMSLWLLLAGLAVWSFTYACFWLVESPDAMRFWLNCTYFGAVTVPVAFFVFVVRFTGRDGWLTDQRLPLLAIIPVLTLLMLWTDPWHDLMFGGTRTDATSVFFEGGPWFWVNVVYSYGLLLIGVIVLVDATLQAHRPYRQQVGLFLFAALLPWVSNIASMIDVNPWPELDLTPIVFTASGLIIAYGLFVVRLLDLVPIAHHTIFETMDDGVVIVDGQRRIIDVNPAADGWLRRHFTIEAASVVGQSITRYFPAWADWVAGQPPEFLPVEATDVKDPTLRRYRPTISPLHDRRGRPLGHALMLHNITRIKQIQDALRQSLEYREALYNALNDAIFVHDAVTGRMLDCNLRACELYGYTSQEMLGLNSLEPLSAGYAPYTLRDILGWMRKARDEGPQVFEWLGQRKDGTLFWVEVRLRYDVIGGQQRFIVSSHDISDRKQTQEALRGSEARLNALLNAIPDLMFRIRRDGTVLDFHQRDGSAGLALPEALVGHPLDQAMPQLARPVMHQIELVLDEGGIAHDELTLNVKAEPRYFDARTVACASDEAVMILRDITEQRRAERQIFQVTLERERVDIMSSFIQDASHEFRTPLSVIQTNLHLLSRVTDPDKQAVRRRNIEEQVMRITRLVDMLVTLSRLDSGVPLTYEPVDLNQLISQLVARIASAGVEKEVAVTHDLDATLPYITADSDRLIDAFEHLLDNAVRYTPPGGSVMVRTTRQNGAVSIEVSDSGPGIAEAIQPYIFSRFFRADVAHTTPGIGLGLAIAQKVVERHGGQITVSSDGETGARFSINLPLAPQATAGD